MWEHSNHSTNNLRSIFTTRVDSTSRALNIIGYSIEVECLKIRIILQFMDDFYCIVANQI